MCDIDVCYKCKRFCLKEVTEGEHIGWCSLCNECIDDVDCDKSKGDKHKI